MNLNLLRFSIILFICSNLSCGQTHSKDLKSIHEKFEYKNKPIDPKLLHKFLPWLSDRYPIVTTVNIAAAYRTNEYSEYTGITTEENGYVKVTFEDGNYTRYKWFGKLDNDIHLVEVDEGSRRGTGVFSSLLLLNFDVNKKKQDPNLNMNLIGHYLLGDRIKYEITTLKNKIFIENEIYENNKLVLKCKKDYCYELKK